MPTDYLDASTVYRPTPVRADTATGARTRGNRYAALVAIGSALATTIALMAAAPAAGDNRRLNQGVVANIYTVQHQAGCTGDVKVDPQLQLAAQWHSNDVLINRSLDGDIGSDGSTPQQRGEAAGFRGRVSETMAINPALAISGVELITQWYYRPDYLAIMRDCTNTTIGVWSENSLDRTVIVAVYGAPD